MIEYLIIEYLIIVDFIEYLIIVDFKSTERFWILELLKKDVFKKYLDRNCIYQDRNE